MKDKLTDEQINAVLAALNDAITQGPWEESNFLRVIGKNLREIRDDFNNQLANHAGNAKMHADEANKMAIRSSQQEVYISLYSSEGNNLQSWERIVTNLPRQMISRPIYANEDDVKFLIKSKDNKLNEAYIAIFIDLNDILTLAPDKMSKDKFGKLLMTLKDRSLKLENVSRFVHLSGVYNYTKGRLIKKSPMDLTDL